MSDEKRKIVEKIRIAKRVGWFEFNLKMIVGRWLCRRMGHGKIIAGRCNRCLTLKPHYTLLENMAMTKGKWMIPKKKDCQTNM